MKALCDLFNQNVNFHQNRKLETLFRQSEKPRTKDVTLTLLNTNFSIFFYCSFSLFGIDCVILQMFDKGKLAVISFNYRTSTTKERELYYVSCTPRIRKFKNKIRTQ